MLTMIFTAVIVVDNDDNDDDDNLYGDTNVKHDDDAFK